MNVQDFVVVAYLTLLMVAIGRGVTGPRHIQTHVLLIMTGFFVPFISFDLATLHELPIEAWGVCGAFLFAQVLHAAFHLIKPEAPHRDGPEILMQPLLVVWVVAVRHTVPPDLWYRGDLGVFLFCTSILFVSLAVLMVIYMGGSTAQASDEIDFLAYTLRSPSNVGFVVASATATGVTLFVTFGNGLFLVGAIVAFLGLKVLLPPLPESVERRPVP
jgi:hypothetical protein